MGKEWFDELFGDSFYQDNSAAQESMEAARKAEAERVAAVKAEMAARKAEREANRCHKCSGKGYLSQFAHRKGGECFTCGGTGIFTRYAV